MNVYKSLFEGGVVGVAFGGEVGSVEGWVVVVSVKGTLIEDTLFKVGVGDIQPCEGYSIAFALLHTLQPSFRCKLVVGDYHSLEIRSESFANISNLLLSRNEETGTRSRFLTIWLHKFHKADVPVIKLLK